MARALEVGEAGQSGQTGDHIAGLDGLRAISVLVVMLYHAHVTWMKGGYLGVEVFFGISGFLITRGLLLDHERLELRPGAYLWRFWRRRFGRLLPALWLFLATVVCAGAFVLGSRAAQFRGDLLPSFIYYENWHQIASGNSYFADQGLPLLRHIWSLAVEEQFYIVWPLLVAGILYGCRAGRKVLVAVTAGLALVSLGLLLRTADPGNASSAAAMESLNRAYLGTDTRAFGLLAGALMALVPPRLPKGWLMEAGAALALAGLLVLCSRTEIQAPFLYRGGFQLVDLLTLFLIAYLLSPGAGPVARLLDWRPMEWIGQRSYGIYLWHWLFFRLVGEGQTGVSWILLRMALTFLVAGLSFHFVETPIRRWAQGRPRRVGGSGSHRAWKWVAVTAGALLFAVATPAAVHIARLPAYHDEVEESLRLNAQALDPAVPSLPTSAPASGSLPAVMPAPIVIPPAGTAPLVLPEIPTGELAGLKVTAIGDSVMKGAAIALKEAGAAYLGPDNLAINAEESRSFSRAYDIVKAYKDKQRLGDVVVIHLGTNNSNISDRDFKRLSELLADRRLVLFLTAKSDKTEICDEVNARLEQLVKTLPNARVYDWKAATLEHPELFYSDQTHLRPSGARSYAALIMGQLHLQAGKAMESKAPENKTPETAAP